MDNKGLSSFDLLIESHLDLERQGPGSHQMTLKALSFIENLDDNAKIVDIGCGTGTQTMVLAQNTAGRIKGIDMVPDFIGIFNDRMRSKGLHERVQGMVGDALALPFEKGELDLIWSEGMIDSLGFEKTLAYWNVFLKEDGYVAVTSPSWLTRNRPEEIDRFWVDAGSGLYSIEDNVAAMQKAGYGFVAAFALPEECWMEGYFIPRMVAEKTLLEKYPGNPMVEEYVESMKYEVDLYVKHKKDYGYVFYIGKKA
ncbi:methyltransferase domain-containing protein [Eubacteriales bacterium OttesenSCG-928-M02]|nr:methyltransferase domain-containing protein [Eubacteriales bacterium OttesenSCG-928-M02]